MKNKNIGIILGALAVVVIAGGVYASMQSKNDGMSAENTPEEVNVDAIDVRSDADMAAKNDSDMAAKKEVDMAAQKDTDTMVAEEPTVMRKDTGAVAEAEDTNGRAGSYEAFSPEKLARADTGDVVLFFHASWCPSCRGLNSSIESNLASLPAGVTILKTDYDKETKLKKKYGVTTQHTLVQVDAQGTLLKKWSGSPSLEKLLAEIQ